MKVFYLNCTGQINEGGRFAYVVLIVEQTVRLGAKPGLLASLLGAVSQCLVSTHEAVVVHRRRCLRVSVIDGLALSAV